MNRRAFLNWLADAAAVAGGAWVGLKRSPESSLRQTTSLRDREYWPGVQLFTRFVEPHP